MNNPIQCIKNWFRKRVRNAIESIVCSIITDELNDTRCRPYRSIDSWASQIEQSRINVECLKGIHEWSDWSSYAYANEAIAQGEVPYRSRRCDNLECRKEMPESRIYNDGRKEKNALEYEESWRYIYQK